jgi:hypothetical protein
MKCHSGYHTALVGTSHFLQKATECNEFQYGSCHVFSWWFCQLETIDKDDIQAGRWNIGSNHSTVLWNWKALIATRTVQCCGSCLRCAMKDSQKQIVKSWIQELSTGTTWNAKMENTRFATFYNAKRCGINIDVFRSYLETPHWLHSR